jgi:hypothetical protein
VDLIHLPQDMGQWRALVGTVMSLLLQKRRCLYRTFDRLLISGKEFRFFFPFHYDVKYRARELKKNLLPSIKRSNKPSSDNSLAKYDGA